MTINITLFIQMIHFWIAYCIMRYVVLKPLILLIQQESKEIESLEHDVTNITSVIGKQEKKKDKEWKSLQESFASHKPEKEVVQKTARSDVYKAEELLSEDKKSLEKELAKKVFERIRHVHE